MIRSVKYYKNSNIFIAGIALHNRTFDRYYFNDLLNSWDEINGIYTYKSTDGRIGEEGCFERNKKHGVWSSYYDDGKYWFIINYRRGKKHGIFINWDDLGVKRTEGFWKNDKKSGLWIYRDESGHKYLEEVYQCGKVINSTNFTHDSIQSYDTSELEND
jgi:hypothetical protein